MMLKVMLWVSFFFQAEDGIRDGHVTGVQTCALPISTPACPRPPPQGRRAHNPLVGDPRPSAPSSPRLPLGYRAAMEKRSGGTDWRAGRAWRRRWRRVASG